MKDSPEYRKELQAFLVKNPIMYLATLDSDGGPRVTTLLFFVDDDFNFYFATHPDAVKYENILRNNSVAWTIGGFDGNKNVQVKGSAEPVEDSALFDSLVEELADRAISLKDFWPPVLQVKSGEYVFIKLKPSWLRVLDIAKTIGRNDDPYTELIF